MRQRAIEQFADVTTAFVAETFDLIDYPRSKSATRIKSDATNNRTNDSHAERSEGSCQLENLCFYSCEKNTLFTSV